MEQIPIQSMNISDLEQENVVNPERYQLYQNRLMRQLWMQGYAELPNFFGDPELPLFLRSAIANGETYEEAWARAVRMIEEWRAVR